LSGRSRSLWAQCGGVEFLAQHVGEFFHGDFNFPHVSTGIATGRALPVSLILPLANGLANIAFALSRSAGAFGAMLEVRDIDTGDRNADGLAAFAAEHFAVVNVLPQILADASPDDFAEAFDITIDGTCHAAPPRTLGECKSAASP